MSEPQRFLGKYQILNELGRGGFATVYRARDRDLDRQVALKVLDPLLTRDPVWVARFRREAQAVARLDHPRVVTVYEIGQAEGALFIATKVVEGGSLAERLAESGALPWPDVLRITAEIAEALDYAHAQGVLHRDLKPANVLLDPRTGAVLTDFGFARLVADNSLSLSLSGGIVGTPAYIAPEVWEGKEAGAATDVYALGCIVYELATGQPRFQGATPPATMLAHFQPPPLPTAWPEGAPEGLTEVLRSALTRDPQARYAVAGDLVTALAALSVDPLAEPYAELEATLATEDWQGSLALVDAIKARNPSYHDIAGLEQRALAGLAQAACNRQIADWRAMAEQALAQGNLEGAELALSQWQRLAPDDVELAQAKAALQARQETDGTVDPLADVVERGSDVAEATEDAAVESTLPAAGSPPAHLASSEPETPAASGSLHRPARSWLGWLAAGAALVAVLAIGVQALNGRGAASPLPTDTPAPSVAIQLPTHTPMPPTNTPMRPDATPTVNPTPWPDIGTIIRSGVDGMRRVSVPAGEFLMGSPEGEGDGNEHPQHTVYLDAFWIDRTEVSAAQYRRCVEAGACSAARTGGFCTYANSAQLDRPINCVDWNQAVDYCQWAGGRLPTEAEWEKAARGSSGDPYPWGNASPDCNKVQYSGCAGTTANVGSKSAGASPYGAWDMAGNVWEWVADWYDKDIYTQSLRKNPTGPETGSLRVLRGGSWASGAAIVRVANRSSRFPDSDAHYIGFRCARSP
jgi:formylglycine-generating enzyme required for sulfatase activity